MGAQVVHNGSRVHLGENRDAATLKIIVGHLGGTPVGAHCGELARDQGLDIRPRGFRVAGGGAIVADMGIGEYDDLTRVRGVGEDLLVAGERGVEDDLAGSLNGRTECSTAKDAPIFERQNCLHCLLLRNPNRSGFNRFYQHLHRRPRVDYANIHTYAHFSGKPFAQRYAKVHLKER